jgi:ATP-dependent Zn protease
MTFIMQSEKLRIVREAYERAKARLTELKPGLEMIARELAEQKEIRGPRVKEILATATRVTQW